MMMMQSDSNSDKKSQVLDNWLDWQMRTHSDDKRLDEFKIITPDLKYEGKKIKYASKSANYQWVRETALLENCQGKRSRQIL